MVPSLSSWISPIHLDTFQRLINIPIDTRYTYDINKWRKARFKHHHRHQQDRRTADSVDEVRTRNNIIQCVNVRAYQ